VWKVILLMDKKDRALGKWSPSWEGPWEILTVFSNNAYEIEELNDDQRVLRINGKYLKRYKPLLQEMKITQVIRKETKMALDDKANQWANYI